MLSKKNENLCIKYLIFFKLSTSPALYSDPRFNKSLLQRADRQSAQNLSQGEGSENISGKPKGKQDESKEEKKEDYLKLTVPFMMVQTAQDIQVGY